MKTAVIFKEVKAMKKKKNNKIILYIIIVFVGVLMVYPLIWMIMASFKTNSEIFGSVQLLPDSFSFDSFVNGWQGTGQYNYTTYFINTFWLVIPTTLFTVFVFSCCGIWIFKVSISGKEDFTWNFDSNFDAAKYGSDHT